MHYWLKNQVKGVAIMARNPATRKAHSVKHPTLTTINQQFKAGEISRETAWKMAQELKDSFKPKQPRVFHSENAALLDRYWEDVQSLKDNVDPQASYNRLVRGINAVGKLSLHVAEKKDLIKALRSAPNRREATAVVNQFLSYLGRPFKLPAVRQKRLKVTYQSWEQFKATMSYIEDVRLRHLFTTLYCTGCRVGEAFSLQKILQDKVAMVEDQMRRDLEYDYTKTGDEEARRVPIIPKGLVEIKAWIAVPESEKQDLRNERLSEELGKAYKKAGTPPITAKDLRHCYAIELANRGVSIGLIAKALGNSETVCNRYYSGFTLTDPGVEAVADLLK